MRPNCLQRISRLETAGARENLTLEPRVLELAPKLLRDAPAIVEQIVARKILADVLDIARQQEEGVRVETRINRLREVYNTRPLLPVEDIVRREVAVDVVVSQTAFDVV